MAEYDIRDDELTGIKDKVVLITGGSSGIGLSAVNIILSLGAFVVDADLQPPAEAIDSSAFLFHATDVSSWQDLTEVFNKTKEVYGRVDHVFANAGIALCADYLATDLDENDQLKEPTHRLLDINLQGVINTTILAIHHMKHQDTGGSVVITGSVSGMQRFRLPEYCTSKHAVVGFMRSMTSLLEFRQIPVRVNLVAPGWTDSAIVPEKVLQALNVPHQTAEHAARAAIHLMADESRKGHHVYVTRGRYKEVDESVLLPAYKNQINDGFQVEDTDLTAMAWYAREQREKAEAALSAGGH